MKNPTASAGFEPANLGTKGQYATFRPPKPQLVILRRDFHVISACSQRGPRLNIDTLTSL